MMTPEAIGRAALTFPEWAITFWPGTVGRRLRAAYWKKRLGAMGRDCIIDVGVVIANPADVFLGDNVWIDNYVHLLAGAPRARDNLRIKPREAYRGRTGEIHIGSNTHVAPMCVLQGHGGISIGRDCGIAAHAVVYSLSHHYRAGDALGDAADYASVMKFTPMAPAAEQALIAAPVVLGDATAIGLGSVVLPGTTVGRYTWIGVGSVVQGDVPASVIASGNPLRVLKQRFGDAATASA